MGVEERTRALKLLLRGLAGDSHAGLRASDPGWFKPELQCFIGAVLQAGADVDAILMDAQTPDAVAVQLLCALAKPDYDDVTREHWSAVASVWEGSRDAQVRVAAFNALLLAGLWVTSEEWERLAGVLRAAESPAAKTAVLEALLSPRLQPYAPSEEVVLELRAALLGALDQRVSALALRALARAGQPCIEYAHQALARPLYFHLQQACIETLSHSGDALISAFTAFERRRLELLDALPRAVSRDASLRRVAEEMVALALDSESEEVRLAGARVGMSMGLSSQGSRAIKTIRSLLQGGAHRDVWTAIDSLPRAVSRDASLRGAAEELITLALDAESEGVRLAGARAGLSMCLSSQRSRAIETIRSVLRGDAREHVFRAWSYVQARSELAREFIPELEALAQSGMRRRATSAIESR